MEESQQKDLPLPQTDLPLPEKEISEHSEIPASGIRKGKWVRIAILILLLVLIPSSMYLLGKNNAGKEVPCTQEAKICPDGSSVGRTGPSCEFAKCPTGDQTGNPNLTPGEPKNETSDWKTYTDTKNKVQLKYPVNYLVEEGLDQEGSHNVYFFSSPAEKSDFDKCLTDNIPECNSYSLALKFDSKNKPQTRSLETSIKEDFDSDQTNYQSLQVAGYPALQDQFEGIGIVNNTFINRGSSVFHVFANSITDQNTNIQIYKNMLSTLKFTN